MFFNPEIVVWEFAKLDIFNVLTLKKESENINELI